METKAEQINREFPCDYRGQVNWERCWCSCQRRHETVPMWECQHCTERAVIEITIKK